MFRFIRSALKFAGVASIAALVGVASIAIGGGGATGTGRTLAMGRISDFGSIFVNGIEFFTSKAGITVNGSPNRSESDLKIGMVLTVVGTVDGSGTKGDAITVVYHADALGMVDRAPQSNAFGVLGQDVRIDAGTVFAGFISLGDLHVGDFVEVSGFPGPDGILASRIERKSSVPMVQAKGTVAGATASTFNVGALEVDYSIATLKNVPSRAIADGQLVVVNGPAPAPGAVLVASSVEVLSQSLVGNTNGSLSGVLSSASAGAIVLNGQSISISAATQYVNGNAGDLAAGRSVKVDVAIVGNAAAATRIEFARLNAPAQVEGDVTAVAADGFEVLGPGGATVTFASSTEWRDQSDARLRVFGVSQMRVGDHVQIRGNQVDVATLLADRITRLRPSQDVFLSGRTLSVSAPNFTVIDIPVTTDAQTAFRDQGGAPISAAAFFARAAGHNVDVTSTRLADGTILATQVRMD